MQISVNFDHEAVQQRLVQSIMDSAIGAHLAEKLTDEVLARLGEAAWKAIEERLTRERDSAYERGLQDYAMLEGERLAALSRALDVSLAREMGTARERDEAREAHKAAQSNAGELYLETLRIADEREALRAEVERLRATLAGSTSSTTCPAGARVASPAPGRSAAGTAAVPRRESR